MCASRRVLSDTFLFVPCTLSSHERTYWTHISGGEVDLVEHGGFSSHLFHSAWFPFTALAWPCHCWFLLLVLDVRVPPSCGNISINGATKLSRVKKIGYHLLSTLVLRIFTVWLFCPPLLAIVSHFLQLHYIFFSKKVPNILGAASGICQMAMTEQDEQYCWDINTSITQVRAEPSRTK